MRHTNTVASLSRDVGRLKAAVFGERTGILHPGQAVPLMALEQVVKATGVPKADIRRLQRLGKIQAYGGHQPRKKRYRYSPDEVLAAYRRETRAPLRGFDVRELFARHNIPSSRALSGVSS